MEPFLVGACAALGIVVLELSKFMQVSILNFPQPITNLYPLISPNEYPACNGHLINIYIIQIIVEFSKKFPEVETNIILKLSS